MEVIMYRKLDRICTGASLFIW